MVRRRKTQIGETDVESTAGTCAAVGPEATIRLCIKRTGKKARLVSQHQDVCSLVRGLGNEDRESFVTLHLDAQNHVTNIDRVAVGSLASVEVHPREVFKTAMLGNAKSIILAHNHPSGNVAPSQQDIELTKRLKEVGVLMGIPVLDHVLVTSAECGSMAAQGYLDGYTQPPAKAKK
jgi:DNA repair protein RadC